MKKLPVGISNLREIIQGGYAYVDKSQFVHNLYETGKYYFLSRPRRFGKSLFVDTLKEAFEGNQDLFRGLWLQNHWDWKKCFPVIHISFGSGVLKSRKELDEKIFSLLDKNQKRLGINCEYKESVSSFFSDIISKSSEKYGLRAVILIDEYDKPILDNRKIFIPSLQNTIATEMLLGSFDVNVIEVEPLMFQTGYLTIRERQQYGNLTAYRLDFPNLEVKMSFTDSISACLLSRGPAYERQKINLYQSLSVANITEIEPVFRALFAAIPHDWYRKNRLSEYEGYYASIFYCYFTALGLDVTPEDTTNHGRIDMTVHMDGRVYIFEFKVVDIDKTPGGALEQIKQKGYADKYRGNGAEIYLIGVEFDRNERNIIRFEWEQDTPN